MNDQSTEPSNTPSDIRPQPLYVTLILDETGSMQECKGAAIAGFNQYVATLREEPAENGMGRGLLISLSPNAHTRQGGSEWSTLAQRW